MKTLQEVVDAQVADLTAIIAKVAYVHGVRHAVGARARIVEMIMAQPVITNEQIEEFMSEEELNGAESGEQDPGEDSGEA